MTLVINLGEKPWKTPLDLGVIPNTSLFDITPS